MPAMNRRVLLLACAALSAHALAAAPSPQAAVDAEIPALMRKHGIPGMAVGLAVDSGVQVYNYGVASKADHRPVTRATLFEIGSLSKTFTAALASYAQAEGRLSLADPVTQHLPALAGGGLERVTLLNLGTQTSGLPLFVPDDVDNAGTLRQFMRRWRPRQPAGGQRVYSNIGIGVLGQIAAASMRMPYAAAVEGRIFAKLGMDSSFVNVPAQRMRDYAQGYDKNDRPARLTPALLADEAYGVRTSAADLARFLNANMGLLPMAPKLRAALEDTHIGYYRAGVLTQGLIWEQYPYPVDLPRLLSGNAPAYIYQGMPAQRLDPPLPPQTRAFINKTGSTNGFSAYAAYIPEKRLGIVLLANKSYPLAERVSAAYRILARLDGGLAPAAQP